MEWGGIPQGVKANNLYTRYPAQDTYVNTHAMHTWSTTGELYPAQFDITPGKEVGKNCVDVPLDLPAGEMTAKKK